MTIVLVTRCGCRQTVERDATRKLPGHVAVSLATGRYRLFKHDKTEKSYPNNDVYHEVCETSPMGVPDDTEIAR